ncbi:hypothetical protein AHAS_Ahas18G0190200 [Arachis hypogaea]
MTFFTGRNLDVKSQSKAGRATWCRRRGTPSSNPHLGVPLEDPGMARQCKRRPKQGWACHLVSKAWHAKLKRTTLKWVCHLSIKAWHASTSFQRRS